MCAQGLPLYLSQTFAQPASRMQRQKALLLLRVLIDSKPQLLLTLGEKKVLQTIDRVADKIRQEGEDKESAVLSSFVEGLRTSIKCSVERIISTLAIDLHKHTTSSGTNARSTEHAIHVVLPQALRLLLQLLNCPSFQSCALNPHVVSHVSIFVDVCQLQATSGSFNEKKADVEGTIPHEAYELIMLTVEALCHEKCVKNLIHESKTSRSVLEQLLFSIGSMLQSESNEMRIHCLQMLCQIVPFCIEEGSRIKGDSDDKRGWEQAIYQFVVKNILFAHGEKLLSACSPIPQQILQLLCLLARVCPRLVADMFKAEMLPVILSRLEAHPMQRSHIQHENPGAQQFSVHAIFLVQAILEWCVCDFESNSCEQQDVQKKCLFELQALGTGSRIVENMAFSLDAASTDSLFPLLEIMHDMLTALQKSQQDSVSLAVNVDATLYDFCKPFCASAKTLISLLGDDGLDAADSIVATRQLRDLASKILLQLLSMFSDTVLTELFPIEST